jgi:large subunit ribosomal protein L31e
MAKEKKTEKLFERNYTIPLRSEWLKAPRYRRAKKAIRAMKEFLAKHMKVKDRELGKIKIDGWVNRAIWSRGIKNVPHKITVKATKYSDETVQVELIGLPKSFKAEDSFLKKKIEKAKKREEAKKKEMEKKEKEKKAEKIEPKEDKSEEEKIEEEKKKAEEKELHKEKEIKHEHQHIGHEVKGQVKTSVHKTNTNK